VFDVDAGLERAEGDLATEVIGDLDRHGSSANLRFLAVGPRHDFGHRFVP
jgi:hypothetical protein